MTKQHVLVAGGAGYIGSHVCKALAQAGFTPVTYDNLSHGHAWAVKWGPLIKGDIHDTALLEETLQLFKPVAAIHLAGHLDVRESLRDPGKYYRNNVFGTLTFIEALCKHDVKFLVFSSSAAVYGIPGQVPIDEAHPTSPINPYGWTKRIVEEMLKDFFLSKGLASVSLRYFNAAGADPSGEIGEAHNPETHLIPLAIQTALKKRSHLNLFGEDHPTPDGTAIRDYIHVSDLAQAHVRSLQWLIENKQCMTLNLGTGTGFSVREILKTIEKQTGCPIPVELTSKAPGDPPILVANPQRAQTILKWKPVHSQLSTIIETAWKWHASRKP